tara:strand:- start:128 stop:436 length:309 start_codon:yes stop_codon:yes gene_type:complete
MNDLENIRFDRSVSDGSFDAQLRNALEESKITSVVEEIDVETEFSEAKNELDYALYCSQKDKEERERAEQAELTELDVALQISGEGGGGESSLNLASWFGKR